MAAPAAAQRYSYAQLQQLWINAGGPASAAPTAAAIAEAESGGLSNAAYPGTTVAPGKGSNTDATGLWQILGVPPGFSPAQLTDPAANAAMAVAKYKGAGNSFQPWVTYTNGAYKAFLNGSTTPDPSVPPATAGAAAGTVTQATLDAATASASTCLVGFTSPSVLGIGGGTVCILSKAQMRALVGGGLLAAGGLLFLAGAVLVVGIGLGQSATAAKLARLTPAGRVVSAVT